MTLTIVEKNHWKERITRKLDRAIDDLFQRTDPKFRHKIKEQARAQTIKEFGVADELEKSTELKSQIDKLKAIRDSLNLEIERTIKPFAKEVSNYYDVDERIERMIGQRQANIEQEITAETPLGKQIKRLEMEQEEMLDTVWLATSPKEIVNLWSRVVTMLQQPLTDLQRETLATVDEKKVANE